MDKITGSAETLMHQASVTAKVYFLQAVKDIDEKFGEGYAEENPSLIGQYMFASSNDYMATSISSSLQDIVKVLEN